MTDEKAARLAAIRAAKAAGTPALAGAPPTQMSDEKAARLAAIRAAKAAGTPAPVASSTTEADPFADLPPAMVPQALLALLLGSALGALAAALVLPLWLPGLSSSLLGAEPKAYWHLARSSAMVAYLLLWLSMLFGLLMTSRMARVWPGGPLAFDLHQHTSLLGLAFALFHALILLGDQYIATSLNELLIPFTYQGYAPFWVGLGQIALYGLALVGFSFYVKDRIGRRGWRLIHFLSFAIFALALAHGVLSGSDSRSLLIQVLYWSSAGSILFLSLYRMLGVWMAPARPIRT
ncbi:MAG: hypothetical protein AB4911_10955 [Oscillochloridaceae bacterium umkhey_bin13]